MIVAGTVTYIAPASTDVGGAVAYGVEISFVPETSEGQALPVRPSLRPPPQTTWQRVCR